jgi:protein-L-isoaspartate O-methyltransferase
MGLDYILVKVKGVPEREALYLKKIMGLDVFVETGTYYGYTALRMSKIFDKVYTIEKSEALFNKVKEK